jgi:AcrR family transcriptional regulator
VEGTTGRREDILRAASQCFSELGYVQANVRDIVARAGTTAPTFYRYFDGKAGVLDALVPERVQAVLAAVAEAADRAEPGLEQLAFVVHAGALALLRDPLLRGLLANARGDGKPRAALENHHAQTELTVITLGIGAARRDDRTDREHRSFLWLGYIHSLRR